MLIELASGDQLRGDLISRAILRNDLAPIPLTLELEVKAIDRELAAVLSEGKTLKVNGDVLHIVQTKKIEARQVQGATERMTGTMRITALLEAVKEVAFIAQRAVVKENTQLSSIYRACGARLKSVQSDFQATRFYCFKGGTPSYQIAQILQEAGGVVRWKNRTMQFIRLPDLFKQEAAAKLADTGTAQEQEGFLEHYEIPAFFSCSDNGSILWGKTDTPRSVKFIPRTGQINLRNMTQSLVRVKTAQIPLLPTLCAGDIVQTETGQKLAVLTAAHIFNPSASSVTRLWLGELK